jgi:hypothetical protein
VIASTAGSTFTDGDGNTSTDYHAAFGPPLLGHNDPDVDGAVAAAAREVGLPYVRPADWLDRPFGPDDVPADVAATFARGGRNLQRTHSERAERRTARLWADAQFAHRRSGS